MVGTILACSTVGALHRRQHSHPTEHLGMWQIGKGMERFAKFGSPVLRGCTDICSLSSHK